MAKAHAKATTKHFDGEVTDFSEPVGPAGPETVQTVNDDGQLVTEHVRGASLQGDIEAIRARRAKDRALKGRAGKPRRITNYVDAERLRNLHAAGHTHLITTEELVDCEENGFFDLTGVMATSPNLGPDQVPNGSIAPPQAPTPVEGE
jgi:hypothetical protein